MDGNNTKAELPEEKISSGLQSPVWVTTQLTVEMNPSHTFSCFILDHLRRLHTQVIRKEWQLLQSVQIILLLQLAIV